MGVYLALALLAVLLVLAAVALFVLRRQLTEYRQRYAPVMNVDEAVRNAQRELERISWESRTAIADGVSRKDELARQYAAAKETYDRLRREVGLLEENREDISFGLYKPHYDLETSDKYRDELDRIRARQKEMVLGGLAGTCAHEWQVGGSKKEGAKMQKQYLKLMLRAFNGESDAAIARVRWNNVSKMEERISKAHEAINELGGVMAMSIAGAYRDLKLAELRL